MSAGRNTPGASSRTAGSEWVDRYLHPILIERFQGRRPLHCMQICPDDESEAVRLREVGHHCEIVPVDTGFKVPSTRESCDVVFTGRFPTLARREEDRVALAQELHRVIRPGGSLLLVFGNRHSTIDLSRNGPLLHGPSAGECLSSGDAHRIFVDKARFTAIQFLPVSGHFGWNRLPRLLRPLGLFADLYWRHLATPARRWLYASSLNPVLILWIKKE